MTAKVSCSLWMAEKRSDGQVYGLMDKGPGLSICGVNTGGALYGDE